MYNGPLPSYVTTRNARISAGVGTIARMVSGAEPIYREKLSFAEIRQRVHRCYDPYHECLARLIAETRRRFGYCILLDCHSMPSEVARHLKKRNGKLQPVDVVLGDCHGTACSHHVMATAERSLTDMGYDVHRNTPFSGGFVTQHYGQPGQGVHALQIELNRGIYMDETRLRRRRGITTLAQNMSTLINDLGQLAALPSSNRIAPDACETTPRKRKNGLFAL